ncbi:hypothetical protein RAS1_31280 [Phycisphaerae bacterium RAS1]|nr:hypothetical protein RAS1_31280 [Phycisphaerae bacterium RAS1]
MATLPNPVELRYRGFQALVRELGYVDALRFLRDCGYGAGDYTEERRTVLPKLSVREIAKGIDELVDRRGLEGDSGVKPE